MDTKAGNLSAVWAKYLQDEAWRCASSPTGAHHWRGDSGSTDEALRCKHCGGRRRFSASMDVFRNRLKDNPEGSTTLTEITARQRDVLRLLAFGRTNREISQELGISEDSAKKYVHAIKLKLGVSEITQAAAEAVGASLASSLTDEQMESSSAETGKG